MLISREWLFFLYRIINCKHYLTMKKRNTAICVKIIANYALIYQIMNVLKRLKFKYNF